MDRRRVLVGLPPVVAQAMQQGAEFEAFVMAEGQVVDALLAGAAPDLILIDPRWSPGARLLKALRDETARPMPPVALVVAGLEGFAAPALQVVATIVGVPNAEIVNQLCQAVASPRMPSASALAGLTTLGSAGQTNEALNRLAERLAQIFDTPEALVAVRYGGKPTIVAHPPSAAEAVGPSLARLCELSSTTRAPVIAVAGGVTSTLLAAPLDRPGAARDGYLLVAGQKIAVWQGDGLAAFTASAQRLAAELAWAAAFDRIRAERDQYRQTAFLDPLTGVWTKHALEQAMPAELTAARRRGEPVCLIGCDLHGLRMINQKQGHAAGDEALRLLGQSLRAALRTPDLLARFAADVFICVLRGARDEEAAIAVDRLRAATEHAAGGGPKLECTWSVVEIAADDEQGSEAIEHALRALTVAKRKRDRLYVWRQGEDQGRGDERQFGLEAGTLLGGAYQVLHEIARGAMGIVYRAEDLSLGRQVALKLLRRDLAADPEFGARFRREAATLASLRHDHLVQIYAFGAEGEDMYFVMELIEGEALDALIIRLAEKDQYLPLSDVIRLVRDIGATIDVMQKAGIAHRDVKPANILIERDTGRSVLADVGIAKRFGAGEGAAGTPGFSPPEALTSSKEHSSGDVYSLAAAAYAMLTARAPFAGPTLEAVITRQLVTGADPPSLVRPVLGERVDRVMARALNPTPEQRYPTGAELTAALEGAIDAIAVAAAADGLELLPAQQSTYDASGAAAWEEPMARRSTLDVASLDLSRGLWFRALSRVLGVREAAGFIAAISRRDRDLGRALAASQSPDAWLPRVLLERMLESIAASGRDLVRVARELGVVAARDFMPRLLGASPAQLGVQRTLATLPSVWSAYHNWGKLELEQQGNQVIAQLACEGITRSIALTLSGWIKGAVVLAGGTCEEQDITVTKEGCRVVERLAEVPG
jgi:diguanylate cyclase (GGDEF)-like protein